MDPSEDAVPFAGFATVSRDSRLVAKVAGSLTDAIVSGRFPPGARLPAEAELGTQLGVSRTVVREAVRILEARGLVTLTSGRPARVREPDPRTVVDAIELFLSRTSDDDRAPLTELRRAIQRHLAAR